MGARIAPVGRRRLVTGLAVAYLVIVAFGVFGPEPGDQIRTAGQGARNVASEIGTALPGGGLRVTRPIADEGRLFGGVSEEAAANVALFVPLGLLFPLLIPRWQYWTVLVGVAMSAAVEGIQLVLLSWRSPSFGDIATNSLGGVIGFGLWLMAAAWWRWRHPDVPLALIN